MATDSIPGTVAISSDNCRVNSAMVVSATDSNEPGTDTTHTIDSYTYAPEWVPDRAARVVTGPQAKTKDPGTK